MDINKASNRAL